jgi:hypothetical protein
VPHDAVANIWQSRTSFSAGEELHKMYELIIAALQREKG